MIEPVLAAPFDSAGTQHLTKSRSAASWPAIIAGAFVAAATSLILIALGSGIGSASISPWVSHGVSATPFTIKGVIWLIFTQWLSACAGGYIAGRLRTRWVGIHTHEVFFRDTAHGFITWCVATVLGAGIFGSSLFVTAAAGVHAASEVPSDGAKSAPMSATLAIESYQINRLLRPADSSGAQTGPDARLEVAGIFANAAVSESMPDADRAYLTQLIAARTGVSQADAQKRVDDFIASMTESHGKTQAAADAAREAAAQLSIYLALSLLVGAFIASVSAALGGRLRDEHP